MDLRRPPRSSAVLRRGALALAVAVAMHVVPARAADDRAAANKGALPGQIYIVGSGRPGIGMGGLMKVDPNERTCVTVERTLRGPTRVAPGGRRIAFAKLEPQNRQASVTSLLDLQADQAPVQIDNRLGLSSWSGDGKELIFSLVTADADSGKPRSWRLNADGSGRKALAIPATELVVDWSPDGQWLVTSSARHGIAQGAFANLALPVFVMRIDGAEAKEIVPAGSLAKPDADGTVNALTSHVRFAPDGQSVSYVRTRFEGEIAASTKQTAQLWVVGRDGVKPRVILEGTDEDGHPISAAWSPDGKAMAVALRRLPAEGRPVADFRLFVIDADGTNPREITLPLLAIINIVDWR